MDLEKIRAMFRDRPGAKGDREPSSTSLSDTEGELARLVSILSNREVVAKIGTKLARRYGKIQCKPVELVSLAFEVYSPFTFSHTVYVLGFTPKFGKHNGVHVKELLRVAPDYLRWISQPENGFAEGLRELAAAWWNFHNRMLQARGMVMAAPHDHAKDTVAKLFTGAIRPFVQIVERENAVEEGVE